MKCKKKNKKKNKKKKKNILGDQLFSKVFISILV